MSSPQHVLGVDPGRKNLALCLLRPGPDALGRDDVIVNWAVLNIDLAPRALVQRLEEVRAWAPDWADVRVAIERQPPRNPGMGRLQHHLEMYFATLGAADVCAIDPQHKLAFATRTPWWPPGEDGDGGGGWTYAKRKKLAVQTVTAMLASGRADGSDNHHHQNPATAPFAVSKKKDDLADSCLHAMAFAHVVGPTRRPEEPTRVRKIRAVKPSDKHVLTGRYSQGALKFLVSKSKTPQNELSNIKGFVSSCERHFGSVADAFTQLG